MRCHGNKNNDNSVARFVKLIRFVQEWRRWENWGLTRTETIPKCFALPEQQSLFDVNMTITLSCIISRGFKLHGLATIVFKRHWLKNVWATAISHLTHHNFCQQSYSRSTETSPGKHDDDVRLRNHVGLDDRQTNLDACHINDWRLYEVQMFVVRLMVISV